MALQSFFVQFVQKRVAVGALAATFGFQFAAKTFD
jgi:hypothetical protein